MVTLTSTVTGGISPTGTILFKDGATPLLSGISLTNGSASISAAFATAGIHSLTASYSGDTNNATAISPTVSLDAYTETITYFHNDVSGTPLAATNSAGALLWSESYRPYGDPVQMPLDVHNKLWFTGKPYDSTTGLTYSGARYYDPLLGRFTGIDPVGFDESNLHSFNRYAYANNNPNRFVDRDGKSATLAIEGAELGAEGGFLVCGPVCAVVGGAVIAGGVIYAGDKALTWAMHQESAGNKEDGAGEPREGEKGGPGAGKDFSDKTKDKIRERDGNKCVFCKKDTTNEPGPGRSEIDHAESKKNGGNNSENNGQNTCRTCNREKSSKSTAEYQKWKGQQGN